MTGSIKIILPDGKPLEMSAGSSAHDAAMKISPGLARAVVAAKIDGKMADLSAKLHDGAKLILIKPQTPEGLEVVRHSSAHIMAQAIQRLFSDAKLTIGPVIEEGFYYDVARKQPFTPDDMIKIENEMQKIVEEDQPFVRVEVDRKKALELYSDNVYKREVINALPQEEAISIYYNEKTPKSPKDAKEFFDLCSGPHLPSTAKAGAFKLMKVAGAYWRGDAKNDQLQRIYGTAYATKKELDDYLKRLEESEKRDHRKIGKELGLIMFSELAPGMPFLLPNGAIIRNELEAFLRAEHKKRGYVEVKSPIIVNSNIWHTSGHWDHYKDNMYFTKIDEQDYGVKPMNCPGHMLVFANSTRSYRDLPIKMAEFGLVHRHELSGVLSGMFRVRAFTQDDAHIFCTQEQIEQEVIGVLELIDVVLKTFGFEYTAELSTRPQSFMGEIDTWNKAEKSLGNALDKVGMKYEINAGDGAFYGPKIDFKVKDAIGRIWQLSTCQLDFQMPMRFGLKYEGADGQSHIPVAIHRAIYGSMERFMGILIEHYAGKFPIWISPVQVALLPVSDEYLDFANIFAHKLQENGLRVFVNEKTETINAKIRDAQLQKIPYMLVIGKKEQDGGELQIRERNGKQYNLKAEEFISHLKEIVEKKGNVE
ncbi:MAG: threonine--tRNA ligase [Candidatus Micrarchaeia archaeon]